MNMSIFKILMLLQVLLSSATGCADNSEHAENCAGWLSTGYCDQGSEYYEFMTANCPRTCGVCEVEEGCADNSEHAENCAGWTATGYCDQGSEYYEFMTANCPMTCGVCEGCFTSYKQNFGMFPDSQKLLQRRFRSFESCQEWCDDTPRCKGVAVSPANWADRECFLVGTTHITARSGWTASSLKPGCDQVGPQGEQGEQGAEGEQGVQGANGRKGARGTNDFCSSVGWICSLEGAEGEPGEDGADGENGPTGDSGNVGAKGEMGRNGTPGLPGLPGLKGIKGGRGIDGQDSFPGWDGKQNCRSESCSLRLGPCYGMGSSRFTVQCMEGYAANGIWRNSRFWGLRCCKIIVK